MIYGLYMCAGLLCTNFFDTGHRFNSLRECIAKGYEFRQASGYAWYTKAQCRPMREKN